MNVKKVITIEGVGPAAFKKSGRARYVTVSLAPSGSVCVTVPLHVSYKSAIDAVRSKRGWIREHSQRMEALKRTHAAKLLGVSHLSYGEQKERLIQKTIALAQQHGFTYNKIFIRRQRTRWGSCSAHNNISLNSKLMQLPDTLTNYVILHELLHTRIKNHRRDFWDELNRLTGDAKALSAQVKSYHLGFME